MRKWEMLKTAEAVLNTHGSSNTQLKQGANNIGYRRTANLLLVVLAVMMAVVVALVFARLRGRCL
jgi:hypothetical protein